jgi:predicted DNA-binding antitoxin AbrB/MazE fold protein
MLGQQIEAVFENGVFRPLQPVHLPEHHRVTVLLRAIESLVVQANNGTDAVEEEMDQEVSYCPLPLERCATIRVRIRQVDDLTPLPYPIQEDEDLDQVEHE